MDSRTTNGEGRTSRAFLAGTGVECGDRVVAVLPNIVEAVIAFLATASLGAIWSTCSPEFGDDAICDRFSQIDPKVMITSTEAIYGGKKLFPLRKVQALLDRMPTLQAILTVGMQEGDSKIPTFSWNQLGEPPHRKRCSVFPLSDSHFNILFASSFLLERQVVQSASCMEWGGLFATSKGTPASLRFVSR